MTKGTTNAYTLSKFPGPNFSEENKMHCKKPVTLTEAANSMTTFEKKSRNSFLTSRILHLFLVKY